MNPSRVVVFIDNSNVYRRLSELKKTNNVWITSYNPLVLATKLAGARTLVGVYFYCTPAPAYMLTTSEGKKKHEKQTKYFTAVQKLPGVTVKFGDLKGIGRNLKEKNLDTQLTADMIAMAAQNKFDTAILVSNDSDYISAVEPTKSIFSKKVEILYFKGHISSALWQMADVPRKAKPSFFVFLPF